MCILPFSLVIVPNIKWPTLSHHTPRGFSDIFKHTVSITLINCSLESNIVTSPLYSLQIKMFPLGEHVKPRGVNGIKGRSSLYVKISFPSGLKFTTTPFQPDS
jgi:hypothetical protein